MIFLDDSIVPKEFFTVNSMLTLTGATTIVFLVCNGLQRAFQFNPRWLALVVSLALMLIGTYLTKGGAKDYFAAVINGFLVFATAGGTTQIIGKENPAPATPVPGKVGTLSTSTNQRTFLSKWWTS